MLELKKITKDYKVADSVTTVLKGISLTFRNNEFVSILGPSGCGKTTMLNIIGGLDKFTTGDLIINGKSTKTYKDRDWDTYRNHTIGFVFQSYNLIPHQTILKNVELALSIGGISKKERKQKAILALQKVGLEGHLNKRPNQLSGGQCQRVSIARALVSNPDIILADEPTGALDSETSVQVMDLLKEVAKDRLVIMVTHNAELAENYSTRIVKMLDGRIIEDTNPIKKDEEKQIIEEIQQKESKLTEKEIKLKERKSSMSITTSFGLSGSNLLTKKKRTFITSLACSIGIIGIAIILSVSNGMQSYVNNLQKNSASSNYIIVNQSSTNMNEMFAGSNEEKIELTEYPENTTGVYPYKETNSGNTISNQKLSQDYVDYIEHNINGNTPETNLVLGITYTKDVNLNLIANSADGYKIIGTNNWSEILNNSDYISTQYTTLATLKTGNAIPTEYNEVVLVVDSYNRISTKILEQLGISYDEDNLAEINYNDLLGKEFKLSYNDNFYIKESFSDKFIYRTPSSQTELSSSFESGEGVKIVSILRQNKDASTSWISSGIGYTESLTNKVIEKNSNSEVVNYQKANANYNVLNGESFNSSSGESFNSSYGFGGISGNTDTYEDNLISLGCVANPSRITIYPKDFDSKDKILTILDDWNNSEIYKLYGNEKDDAGNFLADKNKVTYSDVSALLVTMLGSLINIITYILVAFSAVSLVVSSIMIAIITYASVIERTKEIGTIRSLGGRKKDVSNIFKVEASIIGVVSAIIALIVTVLVNSIINAILGKLVGITTIASLSFSTIILMIVLSVGLNLIASLIPAKMASKKDPVVALRAE